MLGKPGCKLRPCCIPQGRVADRWRGSEGVVSCPGESNPNDPLAEGSRVLPLLPSPPTGAARGLLWSLP
jgi:hypothetical protein